MELRIITRLRSKDIFDFNFYKIGKFVFLFFFFFFFMCLGLTFSGDFSFTRAFSLLIFPITYLIYVVFYSLQRGKCEFLRETVFNDNGIFSRDSRCETYWRFDDITKVVETGKYIYIFIMNTNVFILPKYQLGARENILFIRGILAKHINAKKLHILKNDGSFNDKRKFTFDVEKEIALSKNDIEQNRKYANPLVLSFVIIFVIVFLSFLSDYLREKNRYDDALLLKNEFDYDEYVEYEVNIEDYISLSEKLLFVADDVLMLAEDTQAIKKEIVLVKKDEIDNIQNEFSDCYGNDDTIKELDRLNSVLLNRLFEIVDLRIKYSDEDISDFNEDLEKLRNDAAVVKEKCRKEIDDIQIKETKLIN